VDVSATAVDHNSDGNVNDIQVDFTGTNCGSTPLTHVDLLLEVSDDGGSHWSSAATSLNGNPNPGQQTGTTYFLTNPGAGSYLFRLSGEYDCLKSVDLPHNVPTGYATAGPVVISS